MLRRSFTSALAASVAAVLTAATLLSSGGAALARERGPSLGPSQALVTLDVIHATKAGGVDRQLGALEHTLRRAFKGYAGFSRLDGRRGVVAQGAPQTLALPNASQLRYTFLGVGTDGYLRMSIDVGGLSSTVKVRDGGIFFQAGRGYKGGMIVLAFKVKLQR